MRTRVELEEACALMTGSVRALGVEQVSRQSALGRTLAEDVAAPLDQPPFDRSPLDGAPPIPRGPRPGIRSHSRWWRPSTPAASPPVSLAPGRPSAS
mgnify:CR=1 FL=1